MSRSHPQCKNGHHICQKPSGKTCIEEGCERDAGTLWGPLWCPEHDKERIDRISRQMAAISREELSPGRVVASEEERA